MQTRRWTNPTQPQTLQVAVMLFYISAVFGVLGGGLFSPLGLAIVAGQAAAGFGIANEKRWGYWIGVAVAAIGLLPFVFYIGNNGVGSILSITLLISLIFPVALFALLVHPQSRQYQRVWFN
jgi:uncharacterized membrane protein (DUF2068 family)